MYINKTKSTKTPRSLSQTLVHSTKSPHRTAGSTAPHVPRSRLLTPRLTRLRSLVSRLQLSHTSSLARLRDSTLSHVLSRSSPRFNSLTASLARLQDSTLTRPLTLVSGIQLSHFQSRTHTYTENSRQR